MKANNKNKKIILFNNKLLSVVTLVCFISINFMPFFGLLDNAQASEFSMSTDYLIKMSMAFFDKGRFLDAKAELNKVLMIDPNSVVAKEFLRQIELQVSGQEGQESSGIKKVFAVEDALDKEENKEVTFSSTETAKAQQPVKDSRTQNAADSSRKIVVPMGTSSGLTERRVEKIEVITLNQELKDAHSGTVPITIAQGSYSEIKGSNIIKFLSTDTEKVEITRENQDLIKVKGKGLGNSIFHVWDNSGRWTFEYTGVQPFLTPAFKQELERRKFETQLNNPFVIDYSLDWSSFHTGRRAYNTHRTSLSFNQSISLRGETPYGAFDSSINIYRITRTQYELDNLSMGLTNGYIGGLNNFNLRLFDFNPSVGSYQFPSADLRGAYFSIPMFNNKLNYSVFWGGIPRGNYTRMDPGLGNTIDAYLEGINLNYILTENAKYKFYYAHTYGKELNTPVATNDAFGVGAFHKIGRLGINAEAASDSIGHISYTTSAIMSFNKTNISLYYTEEDRDFASPFGGSFANGSVNGKLRASYAPNADIRISGGVGFDRDKKLFNPDKPKRGNYSYDTDLSYRLDPLTSLSLGYVRNDTRGSLSPGISESKQLGLSRKIFFTRPINLFLNYSNSVDKYYVASATNYDKNYLSFGLSFGVFKDLYFNASENLIFIRDRMTGERASPRAQEYTLSYYSRIMDTPFYGSLRVTYRDEENTDSLISFLSGQDRLEFNSEIDYKPAPGISAFLSLRAAHVWAEKESTVKHFDAEIRYGLHLSWDTGIRWNTKCSVQGFVFNDLNLDGIKGKDEPGIPNVRVSAQGGEKYSVTNESGYYKISNIIGKTAKVEIDLSTIPKGFIFMGSDTKDIIVKHGAVEEANFGLTTRSALVGTVFIDANGNGKFDREDKGLPGVVLLVDGKKQIVSDETGQFLLRNISAGEHIMQIDLKTVPTKYIPQVPLKKQFQLKEGETYFFSVPLKLSPK